MYKFLTYLGLILNAFLVPKWISYATLGALGDTSGSKKAPKDAQGLILVDLGVILAQFGALWVSILGRLEQIRGAIWLDLGIIAPKRPKIGTQRAPN